MAAKSQPAWDIEPGHLTTAELEFLAEDQLVTIMPLTSHPQFNLIQVKQMESFFFRSIIFLSLTIRTRKLPGMFHSLYSSFPGNISHRVR